MLSELIWTAKLIYLVPVYCLNYWLAEIAMWFVKRCENDENALYKRLTAARVAKGPVS